MNTNASILICILCWGLKCIGSVRNQYAVWWYCNNVATTLAMHGKYGPDKQTGIPPGIPGRYSQQVKSSDRLSNDAPAPVKWPTWELSGKYWKLLRGTWPADKWNKEHYTHITQTESILWHWNYGNFLNCILQRYWMPGLVIHCWMSASLVSTITIHCRDAMTYYWIQRILCCTKHCFSLFERS